MTNTTANSIGSCTRIMTTYVHNETLFTRHVTVWDTLPLPIQISNLGQWSSMASIVGLSTSWSHAKNSIGLCYLFDDVAYGDKLFVFRMHLPPLLGTTPRTLWSWSLLTTHAGR